MSIRVNLCRNIHVDQANNIHFTPKKQLFNNQYGQKNTPRRVLESKTPEAHINTMTDPFCIGETFYYFL